MSHSDIVDMVTEHAIPMHAGWLVAEFLAKHDGYSFRSSEQHESASEWKEGQRTLTITIVCPTGEARLPRAESAS